MVHAPHHVAVGDGAAAILPPPDRDLAGAGDGQQPDFGGAAGLGCRPTSITMRSGSISLWIATGRLAAVPGSRMLRSSAARSEPTTVAAPFTTTWGVKTCRSPRMLA